MSMSIDNAAAVPSAATSANTSANTSAGAASSTPVHGAAGANSAALMALRQQLRQVTADTSDAAARWVSMGYAPLDQLLPQGGLPRGALTEFFGAVGGGAGTVSLLCARQIAGRDGMVMVIDESGGFYPPAAALLGIDLGRLLVVRTDGPAERLWAWDQALRCSGVAAVWGPLAQLGPLAYRRLALAAEQGDTIGLLLRSAQLRGLPSWSAVQLWVRSVVGKESVDLTHRVVRVEVTRCRHGRHGGQADLELSAMMGACVDARLPQDC